MERLLKACDGIGVRKTMQKGQHCQAWWFYGFTTITPLVSDTVLQPRWGQGGLLQSDIPGS